MLSRTTKAGKRSKKPQGKDVKKKKNDYLISERSISAAKRKRGKKRTATGTVRRREGVMGAASVTPPTEKERY